MRGKGIRRKIAEIGNQTQTAQGSSQNTHTIRQPEQYRNVFPKLTGQGQPGGFPTVYPQYLPALDHGELDGTRTIDIDLSRFRAHVTKFKLTGVAQTVTFSKPPGGTDAIDFLVEIEQDATGGRTVIWPSGVTPTPVLDTDPGKKTLVRFVTADNGVTYHAQVYGSSGGGGSDRTVTDLGTKGNSDPLNPEVVNLNISGSRKFKINLDGHVQFTIFKSQCKFGIR